MTSNEPGMIRHHQLRFIVAVPISPVQEALRTLALRLLAITTATMLVVTSDDQGAAATARAVGEGAVTLSRRVARRLHAAASADGAGRSGLAALLWTHALQSGADTFVAVSLASATLAGSNPSRAGKATMATIAKRSTGFEMLVTHNAAPVYDRGAALVKDDCAGQPRG